MTENNACGRIDTNQIFHIRIGIMENQPANQHGNKTFEQIAGKNDCAGTTSQNTQSIRGTGIPGAMLSDVDSADFTDNICNGYRS